jgi:hypothetical protein
VHIPEKVDPTKETLPLVTRSTVPVQVLSLKIEFLTVTCTAQLEASTLCPAKQKPIKLAVLRAYPCTVKGEKCSAIIHFLYSCTRYPSCSSKPNNGTQLLVRLCPKRVPRCV